MRGVQLLVVLLLLLIAGQFYYASLTQSCAARTISGAAPTRGAAPTSNGAAPMIKRILLLTAAAYDADALAAVPPISTFADVRAIATAAFVRRPRVPPFIMLNYLLKSCYASMHGTYDVRFEVAHDYREHRVFVALPNKTRPMHDHWQKVLSLRRALASSAYDYVLVSDDDYYIVDVVRRIESFIAQFEAYNVDAHVFVPTDLYNYPHNEGSVFSAYALLLRNSELVRRLVDTWIAHGTQRLVLCPNHRFYAPNYPHMGADQDSLWLAMVKVLDDEAAARGAPRSTCLSACEQPLAGQCFKRAMREHKMMPGHTYERLADVKGPFVFSAGFAASAHADIGLGLQMTFGVTNQSFKYDHTAFGVHAKALNKTRGWLASFERLTDRWAQYCIDRLGCTARFDAQTQRFENTCGHK